MTGKWPIYLGVRGGGLEAGIRKPLPFELLREVGLVASQHAE